MHCLFFASRATRRALVATALMASAAGLAQERNPVFESGPPMDEAMRASVSQVVLKPGDSPTSEEIGGTYEKETYGLEGGMVAGAGATTMHQQVGPVNVAIPIPILQLPLMIAGGIAGATQREIQEFRDALADDLAAASNQQLVDEKIAADVYNEIRTIPNLSADVFARETTVPDGTDVILFVDVEELLISVDGDEAIITATVGATLHRPGDGKDLYSTTVYYQDRDTLGNWTDNDNAAWHDYANFARHYVGREIADRVFQSANVSQSLAPVKSGDVSYGRQSPWVGSSKKLRPTLAWELELPGGDDDPAWASTINASQITYDLEIYDLHRPVYSASSIPGARHAVTSGLEACGDYRWSVRPVYHVDGKIRYGQWMRSGSGGNGNVGQRATEAPAYLYDFATLKIRCGSR